LLFCSIPISKVINPLFSFVEKPVFPWCQDSRIIQLSEKKTRWAWPSAENQTYMDHRWSSSKAAAADTHTHTFFFILSIEFYSFFSLFFINFCPRTIIMYNNKKTNCLYLTWLMRLTCVLHLGISIVTKQSTVTCNSLQQQ
jgi:hypothetical protein